jgi:YfiH family protein
MVAFKICTPYPLTGEGWGEDGNWGPGNFLVEFKKKAMNIIRQSDLRTKTGLPYFEIPEMANIDWLKYAFLTRKGGISPPPFDSLNLGKYNGDSEDHVSKNKDLIAASFGFDRDRLILLRQMHQDRILILKEPDDSPPADLGYDAVITDSPNWFLGIKTADCLPILVIDRVKKVVAAIHAGRQGTALQVTRKALRKMKMEWGCSSRDFLVALGPSIGSCCYEIDEKVFHQEWISFSTRNGVGKWMVDLPRINIAQLKEEGIGEDQLFWVNLCTRCSPDLFYSYRGEGQTGRQLSLVGIIHTD